MIKVLNISNHELTKVQVEDLAKKNMEVMELPDDMKKSWGALTPDNYQKVCDEIRDYMISNNVTVAHLTGFIPAVSYLTSKNNLSLSFIYSYSQRESKETKDKDGKVIKTSVFKHRGWYKYL